MTVWKSAAGDGADDHEGFGTSGDFRWKRRVGRGEGEILGAREEAQEGAALEGDMIADSAAQHGILRFQGVEDGALGNGAANFQADFSGDLRESAEMGWQSDADHGVVVPTQKA